MGCYSPTITGRYLGLISLSEVLGEKLSYEKFVAYAIIKKLNQYFLYNNYYEDYFIF